MSLNKEYSITPIVSGSAGFRSSAVAAPVWPKLIPYMYKRTSLNRRLNPKP